MTINKNNWRIGKREYKREKKQNEDGCAKERAERGKKSVQMTTKKKGKWRTRIKNDAKNAT